MHANRDSGLSYITDHPTHFRWRWDVRQMVKKTQAKWPFKTYINTYWDHPPDFQVPRRWPPGFYDSLSFDVWGGGLVNGIYQGKRGKPLDPELGDKIFAYLFNYAGLPDIDWIIYKGRMWWNQRTGGHGWQAAPWGPDDSDAGHWHHIHVTYIA
jgi:hypothetical protein